MRKWFFAFLILFQTSAFADELITAFKEESIPVLNEELRRKDVRIDSVETRVTTLEANPSLSAASQAEMEAFTSTTTYASPGRTQYHPGVAKALVKFDGQTGAIIASHNVTSVTDNGTGDWTITWTTAFSNDDYVVVGITEYLSVLTFISVKLGGQSTTAVNVVAYDVNQVIKDATSVYVAAFGDQ